MSGTRELWAELLPLLQAFVAGMPIQRKDFCGRWVDTDQMHSLLRGGRYRLKPDKSRMGVWTRSFVLTHPGDVNGAVGTGTLRWEGADTDTPKWPTVHGMTFTSDPLFTPNEDPKP